MIRSFFKSKSGVITIVLNDLRTLDFEQDFEHYDVLDQAVKNQDFSVVERRLGSLLDIDSFMAECSMLRLVNGTFYFKEMELSQKDVNYLLEWIGRDDLIRR